MDKRVIISKERTALLLSWLSKEPYIEEINEYGETVYSFERTDRLAIALATVLKRW